MSLEDSIETAPKETKQQFQLPPGLSRYPVPKSKSSDYKFGVCMFCFENKLLFQANKCKTCHYRYSRYIYLKNTIKKFVFSKMEVPNEKKQEIFEDLRKSCIKN